MSVTGAGGGVEGVENANAMNNGGNKPQQQQQQQQQQPNRSPSPPRSPSRPSGYGTPNSIGHVGGFTVVHSKKSNAFALDFSPTIAECASPDVSMRSEVSRGSFASVSLGGESKDGVKDARTLLEDLLNISAAESNPRLQRGTATARGGVTTSNSASPLLGAGGRQFNATTASNAQLGAGFDTSAEGSYAAAGSTPTRPDEANASAAGAASTVRQRAAAGTGTDVHSPMMPPTTPSKGERQSILNVSLLYHIVLYKHILQTTLISEILFKFPPH